ncbi:hypothetical protein M3P05_06420 [Sansalvadorimonas sp. 2012CJ34-2]|uniref:Uncharacterized protein n=1 Tax=Parendozoicomonas callyspongiae TaxID=2942213 RepID=A0ABT0PDY3_9GAMM|nr:hypothetical protein [Sansalvadorimonas sp. 2012CJ34-2]MCL6269574.1 hypothetical protein [Sansalvadorimonas sp. 2012CJ34-2]
MICESLLTEECFQKVLHPDLSNSEKITLSREQYEQTKELIERMMMKLKFRGLENEYPLIQEAWKTGKAMNDRLILGEREKL